MTYQDKLKDRRWQTKAARIRLRDKDQCQNPVCCSGNFSQLHVHHKYYWFGKDPWEYPDEDYITLCHICHELEGQRWILDKGLSMAFDHAGILFSDRIALTTLLYNKEWASKVTYLIRDFQNGKEID